MPFARIPLVGMESPPSVLVARTARMNQSPPTYVHCNIQGRRHTFFETHLDEPSEILSCCDDGGPHTGLVNERRPPKPANVCQLREDVHASSGTWRRDESEGFEENFDGDFVSEVPNSLELVWCKYSSPGESTNGSRKTLWTSKDDFVVPAGRHASSGGSEEVGEETVSIVDHGGRRRLGALARSILAPCLRPPFNMAASSSL